MDRKPWTWQDCLQSSALTILKEWNSGFMIKSCAFLLPLDFFFCFFFVSITFTFLLTDPSLLEAFLGSWMVGLSIGVGDVCTEGSSVQK